MGNDNIFLGPDKKNASKDTNRIGFHLKLLRTVVKARGEIKRIFEHDRRSQLLTAEERKAVNTAIDLLDGVQKSMKCRVPEMKNLIAAERAARAQLSDLEHAAFDDVDWHEQEPLTSGDMEPDIPFNALGEDEEICPLGGRRVEAQKTSIGSGFEFHGFGPDDDDIPF